MHVFFVCISLFIEKVNLHLQNIPFYIDNKFDWINVEIHCVEYFSTYFLNPRKRNEMITYECFPLRPKHPEITPEVNLWSLNSKYTWNMRTSKKTFPRTHIYRWRGKRGKKAVWNLSTKMNCVWDLNETEKKRNHTRSSFVRTEIHPCGADKTELFCFSKLPIK